MHCPVMHDLHNYLARQERQDAEDRAIDKIVDQIISNEEMSVRLTPTTEKGRRRWMVDVIDAKGQTCDDLAEWFDAIALAADAGERLLEKCAEAEARRRLDSDD